MVVRRAAAGFILTLLAGASALAQPFDPAVFAGLHWRMIGPFRGGRTVAGCGVPGRPGLFYIGVNNGGVWRSSDYGRVWRPIFDDQPTGSIGALAVAPSDPDIIYVGSGEGLQRPDLSTGDGIYRSRDAGRTWQHLGLRDGQQIPAIIVDPRDAKRLFVAVLGHPYGANEERGVFRSTDGGDSFERVLYKDADTGAMDLAFDPANPDTVFAVLWAGRQTPWEDGGFTRGPGSGLFKSTDGGTHWRRLSQGLPAPEGGLGRIGLGMAPSAPGRMFAIVDAPRQGGLYRSDDGGESWRLVNPDTRLWGRGSDFAEVKVDPKNPDVVYVANVAAWKSTDGGRTFTAFRGAPGGDDYHRIWIDPTQPSTILLTADQGAVVSVNGGETWSSWYNQPTAQLYHVSTDNRFPYRVYGGQQESGSVGIASRGNDGQITFRDWHPVGVEEYGYVAPDPSDPDIVYGGRLTRTDTRTGQVQDIAPQALRGEGYRVLRTQPVLFSPLDPKLLFFASNVLWATRDGGRTWAQLSPDLTREAPAVPANLGSYAAREPHGSQRRGVIYTIAPSPRDAGVIWAGTDDGLIHVTRDAGKTWTDVTPPALTAWSKVSLLEASHFDTDTAYAAINTFRLDDLRPHVYRTRDGGKTWQRIVDGIPDGGVVNVVREDPLRRGLLFAGSERGVHVSFDDGDHWQSLRLDMPATSIRDLVLHENDVVVATHGRSFWILDDISRLRQLDARTLTADALLFQPQTAWRVRWNTNTDTPLPPDEPAGENPPDGAIIDYSLRVPGRVVLEILDAAGALVRRYASDDSAPPLQDEGNVPRYWIRPPARLSAEAGVHRFVWDGRWTPPGVRAADFSIAAVAGNTPRPPQGPFALPGSYTVRLTAAGRSQIQPLTLKMDPRVAASAAELSAQLELASQLADAWTRCDRALEQVETLRRRLTQRAQVAVVRDQVAALDARLAGLEGSGGRRATGGLSRLGEELAQLYESVTGVDAMPTPQQSAAAADRLQALAALQKSWSEIQAQEVAALDRRLREARIPPLRSDYR